MKKFLFVAMAALAMMTIACGDKKSKDKAEGEKEGVEVTKEDKASWQTYENSKYGFSIEVPGEMQKKGEMMGDEGTVFTLDQEDGGVAFNRVDVSGGHQIFDEAYTPEMVQEEFAKWTDNLEVASKECSDTWFTYTIEGELFTEIHRQIFNGPNKCFVTVCFDADHEAELGGEVAERIFSSVKFK